MATKVVYFTIDGREEQAEFRSDDDPEDLRGKLKIVLGGGEV